MLLLGTFFINSATQDKFIELTSKRFVALIAVLYMDDFILKFGTLTPLLNLYGG